MSGPTTDACGESGNRSITDELVRLRQAIDLLKIAEDLVQPKNIDNYPGAIASVIRTIRTLLEEVVEALTRYFTKSERPR